MGIYYYDTSALVKLYIDEEGSTWVREIASDSPAILFTSRTSLDQKQ